MPVNPEQDASDSRKGLSRQLALDAPNSAGRETQRRARTFGVVVAIIGLVVLAVGKVQLQPVPEFATFHANAVLVIDGITAVLLFGQFHYRKQWSYLVLASGYLFTSLASIPFLLTFPGIFNMQGTLFGGSQSSIWVWHIWHMIFPAAVCFAAVIDGWLPGPVVPRRLLTGTVAAIIAVVGTAGLVTVAVTLFHDSLPVLITDGRVPLTVQFYVVGWATVAITMFALGTVLRAARRRAVLHVWLVTVLIAYVADALISVGSFSRYTFAWYAGRVESMLAASVLLFVFINELNLLYGRLGHAMEELFTTNGRLADLVREKDALLERVRRSEEEVRNMAYHDPVTGLPNRRLATERMDGALAQAARHGHTVGVLFLDVDYFKEINDRFGHETGDALLREIGMRVRRCLREGDTVARFGGDEFVILLPEMRGAEEGVTVAKKIVDCFSEEVAVLGHRMQVTTSIGIASCTGVACGESRALVRRADAAMYEAKQAGRNRYSISPEE